MAETSSFLGLLGDTAFAGILLARRGLHRQEIRTKPRDDQIAESQVHLGHRTSNLNFTPRDQQFPLSQFQRLCAPTHKMVLSFILIQNRQYVFSLSPLQVHPRTPSVPAMIRLSILASSSNSKLPSIMMMANTKAFAEVKPA